MIGWMKITMLDRFREEKNPMIEDKIGWQEYGEDCWRVYATIADVWRSVSKNNNLKMIQTFKPVKITYHSDL